MRPARTFLAPLAFVLGLGVATAGPVAAADVQPTSAEVLSPFDYRRYAPETWSRHLDLTRASAIQCHTGQTGFGLAKACQIRMLDSRIAAAADPMLTELHLRLPFEYRYREDRNMRPTGLRPLPEGMAPVQIAPAG